MLKSVTSTALPGQECYLEAIMSAHVETGFMSVGVQRATTTFTIGQAAGVIKEKQDITFEASFSKESQVMNSYFYFVNFDLLLPVQCHLEVTLTAILVLTDVVVLDYTECLEIFAQNTFLLIASS